ncbi:unnamed protein product [Symbiodinium pilosum]|uniref:C3H1-type domain-containing protein n=1 Tax=Symbiodinium pilosum TaxID=2952 RepID=A0A812XT67_SYMPI|nr:unnamed protein product [Symbiodinium pilosum]
MIQDLLTIRADRERYYYGVDALFQAHGDIVERLCTDALQLLPTLLDGLVWRSKRAINGARRVNFYVKHLVVNKEGTFSGALKAIADAKDVKIISHQVVVQISDTLWSGVVRRQFIFSKIGFLFSLVVFMLSQAILPKTESADELNMRIAVFAGRLINYAFSMTRLLVFHLRRIFKAFRAGTIMKVGRVPVPEYLKDEDAKLGFILLLMLVAMCASEPMFYCAQEIMTTGPSETCGSAKPVMPFYIIFSMGAMVLHWLLVINLSVFATKLAAFVLVCREVLSEVGKFLVAILFILITFSSAIATLRHDVAEFSTLPKAANCLFATTVGIYEGDYRELMHQPALLAPVLLFITVSAILLINLLIAQLNCSYDYVYGDMLGFARLARASLIVDSMAACPPARFARFVAGLRFDQLLEFDEGDVGLGGGIQIREPANLNPTSDDIILRFGGTSSPDMQWPEEELETDRYARIKYLLAQLNKKPEKQRKWIHGQQAGGRPVDVIVGSPRIYGYCSTFYVAWETYVPQRRGHFALTTGEGNAEMEEEIQLRVPVDLEVPGDVNLRTLQHILCTWLEEAGLQALRHPAALFLGLNGHLCTDAAAQPLRNLVPGSVVSLVEDLGEAQEVARLGLCLNAVQLMQVQFPPMVPGGPPRKIPDEVLREKRQRLYKTQPCANYAAGHCSFGHKCHFAHGEHELRLPGKEGSASTLISKWNADKDDASWKDRSQWSENWKWEEKWQRHDEDWRRDWQDWKPNNWFRSAAEWDWSKANDWWEGTSWWKSDWQDKRSECNDAAASGASDNNVGGEPNAVEATPTESRLHEVPSSCSM